MELEVEEEAINNENDAFFHGKVQEGETLLEKLSRFSSVNGKPKLDRRISAELRFLQKLKSSGQLKREHILSSNIISLSAIVGILERCDLPVGVLQPFSTENGTTNRIEVDVIANGGSVWYKAVARKAEALSQICKGRTSGTQKSVIDQAKSYLKCAQEHPYHFQPPQVIFCFANNVSRNMAAELNRLGVLVEGELIDLDDSSSEDNDSSDSASDYTTEEEDDEIGEPNIMPQSLSPLKYNQLFLDITCMVAYVSSMTNGGANFLFPRQIYNQQAQWERTNPAKCTLDSLFEGKELVTCQEALSDFKTLVDKMGGPGEKQRTEELIQRLRLVPDSPSERVRNLKLSSNVKKRSRIIFGTADQLRIVIVTANTGFIRSAEGQGITIAAHSHEPRVLTEQQQALSTPL